MTVARAQTISLTVDNSAETSRTWGAFADEQYGDFPPYYTFLNYEQQSFGGGLLFGYQNYIKRKFVIDFIVGFGARQITDTKVINSVNIIYDQSKKTFADARLGLNIGYKF